MIKFKRDWLLNFFSNTEPSMQLRGERIVLRTPCIQDYSVWSSISAENKDFLIPYSPKWSDDCLSREFFLRRLKRQKEERQASRGEYFLIHHMDKNTIIGGINLNNIQFGAARHASIGYWLGEEYEGQGYMIEAARLVIDHAFDVLKLRRINAACLPDNVRSAKLLQSLGFEEEGFAKNYLQINGRWQDHRLFGLLCPTREG